MPIGTHPDSSKLGRIRSPFDARDHNHLVGASISPLDRAASVSRRKKRSWGVGRGSKPWDQGNTSECVSFATNRFLVSSPIANKVWGNPTRFDYDPPKSRLTQFQSCLLNFYNEAQSRDGFPLPHDGTTVRAAMEVLLKAGLISEYRWAANASDAARHVLNEGPMVIGVDWTTTMFDPYYWTSGPRYSNEIPWIKVVDDNGNYDVQGGHSLLWVGVDLEGQCPDGSTGFADLFNSWGQWGHNGHVRVSLREMGMLGRNGAEYAMAVENSNPLT